MPLSYLPSLFSVGKFEPLSLSLIFSLSFVSLKLTASFSSPLNYANLTLAPYALSIDFDSSVALHREKEAFGEVRFLFSFPGFPPSQGKVFGYLIFFDVRNIGGEDILS
ncbi:hypothetical protein P8452_72691 [Trifolium repens]|nr:hypothetical protein QL285_047493 [Trifolium repens]WJX90835.1 hypothetical protein P8452_72691 [Trifolium repens]